MPTGNYLELRLGGHSLLRREPFQWGVHPHTNRVRDVIRADFRKQWQRDQVHPRRVLDKLCKRHGIEDWGEFVPPDLRPHVPGRLPHRTAIADAFNRANESLNAGPWTEVIGDWEVLTNEAGLTADAVGLARHTTQLSGDDHKCKVALTAFAASGRGGPVARFSLDASPNHDCYRVRLDPVLVDVEYFKIVDGTETVLDTAKAVTITLPDDLEIECNGSGQISRFNGTVMHNFTDTSLTGQLNCGMALRRGLTDACDDFSAEDLPLVLPGLQADYAAFPKPKIRELIARGL